MSSSCSRTLTFVTGLRRSQRWGEHTSESSVSTDSHSLGQQKEELSRFLQERVRSKVTAGPDDVSPLCWGAVVVREGPRVEGPLCSLILAQETSQRPFTTFSPVSPTFFLKSLRLRRLAASCWKEIQPVSNPIIVSILFLKNASFVIVSLQSWRQQDPGAGSNMVNFDVKQDVLRTRRWKQKRKSQLSINFYYNSFTRTKCSPNNEISAVV